MDECGFYGWLLVCSLAMHVFLALLALVRHYRGKGLTGSQVWQEEKELYDKNTELEATRRLKLDMGTQVSDYAEQVSSQKKMIEEQENLLQHRKGLLNEWGIENWGLQAKVPYNTAAGCATYMKVADGVGAFQSTDNASRPPPTAPVHQATLFPLSVQTKILKLVWPFFQNIVPELLHGILMSEALISS